MTSSPAVQDCTDIFMELKDVTYPFLSLSDASMIYEKLKKKREKTAQSFNLMVKIAVFLCLLINISSPSGSVCK